MNQAWRQFYAAQDVREIDRRAIHECGIEGFDLMCRAAATAWRAARRAWGLPDRLVVFCGVGNNGGDGYEIARLAAADGVRVEVRELPGERQGDAATARSGWCAVGDIAEVPDAEIPPPAAAPETGGYAESLWVVDALFGTGLTRPPEALAAAAITCIEAARQSGARVLAVDVPSGLNADHGTVAGAVVIADLTVTFIADKPGLHCGRGVEVSGEVLVAPLDVPAEAFRGLRPLSRRLDASMLAQYFRPRARNAHKNRHGHVLVVGGAPGMAGAVLLAARAALRAGSGLVSVATHPDHARQLINAQPELMVHAVADDAALAPLLARASVVALGPGLGTGDWGRHLFTAVIASALPKVVDADALNLLATAKQRLGDAILTPHPGEAARLLDTDAATINADRHDSLQRLQQRYGGIVVLKGAGSLISDDADDVALPPWQCVAGNAGLAVGGSGDVLTGITAACLAQGMPLAVAARAGVLAHAHAGDLAAAGGQRGMLPSDLIDALRTAVNA